MEPLSLVLPWLTLPKTKHNLHGVGSEPSRFKRAWSGRTRRCRDLSNNPPRRVTQGFHVETRATVTARLRTLLPWLLDRLPWTEAKVWGGRHLLRVMAGAAD